MNLVKMRQVLVNLLCFKKSLDGNAWLWQGAYVALLHALEWHTGAGRGLFS
jgi:hypothetical protein